MGENAVLVPGGSTISVSAESVHMGDSLPENYSFVMNVSGLAGATSFELAPGHQLRRATSQEASQISETVQRLMSFPGIRPWECARLTGPGAFEPVPEAEWRYHVIGFRGYNDTIQELEQVFTLCRIQLKIGFTIVYQIMGGRPLFGTVLHKMRLLPLLETAGMGLLEFVEVMPSDAENIRLLFDQVKQHDNALIDINALLRQLLDLESLPSPSPLIFLGHFALLEALLIHAPKASDPYDTITRQIKKKMALLDHRCQPAIDYSMFGAAKPDKIWQTMYDYRSAVAHGGSADFAKKFGVLGNHGNALSLIKETVKTVLRQALIEPQLVSDLRDC